MKKLLLLLVVVSCITQVNAQDSLRYNFYFNNNWCLDFNLKLGLESQNLSTYNMVANYPNALNSHVGNLNFTNGLSFGFDAQIGYFFGIKQNFGIGTGILFLQQQGDITLNQFHVEYKSIDYKQDTFRQLITAHSPLKETITTTNFNIPLLAKYKNQFNYQLGFSIDAGILLNIAINNQYNTNAQFDYEAVYKIDTRKDGSHIAVYDATPAPPYNATDILLTKAGAAANQQSNYNQYFDSLYKQGYNVKLGASAKNTKGTASYTSGTIGFMIQPAINYKINQTWGLNLGAFYVFQPFSNNANNSYRLTDKVGSYNSVINAVSTNYNHSYGINIGVRMYIGKNKIKDFDHDGIPDFFDKCPSDSGLIQFMGCPDADGDGIIDKEDSCPHQFGTLQFHGCPDSDGDGIMDKDDSCPQQAGLIIFNGCPDTDGDGVPDNIDACPNEAGPTENHGCPYTTTLDETQKDPKHKKTKKAKKEKKPKKEKKVKEKKAKKEKVAETEPITKTDTVTEKTDTATKKQTIVDTANAKTLPKFIHFEFGKVKIKKASYSYLNKVAEDAKIETNTKVYIDGYTDIIGGRKKNKIVSIARAREVRKYLIKKGVDAKRIIARGHGSQNPIANNKTASGRAMNRRATLTLKENTAQKPKTIGKTDYSLNGHPIIWSDSAFNDPNTGILTGSKLVQQTIQGGQDTLNEHATQSGDDKFKEQWKQTEDSKLKEQWLQNKDTALKAQGGRSNDENIKENATQNVDDKNLKENTTQNRNDKNLKENTTQNGDEKFKEQWKQSDDSKLKEQWIHNNDSTLKAQAIQINDVQTQEKEALNGDEKFKEQWRKSEDSKLKEQWTHNADTAINNQKTDSKDKDLSIGKETTIGIDGIAKSTKQNSNEAPQKDSLYNATVVGNETPDLKEVVAPNTTTSNNDANADAILRKEAIDRADSVLKVRKAQSADAVLREKETHITDSILKKEASVRADSDLKARQAQTAELALLDQAMKSVDSIIKEDAAKTANNKLKERESENATPDLTNQSARGVDTFLLANTEQNNQSKLNKQNTKNEDSKLNTDTASVDGVGQTTAAKLNKKDKQSKDSKLSADSVTYKKTALNAKDKLSKKDKQIADAKMKKASKQRADSINNVSAQNATAQLQKSNAQAAQTKPIDEAVQKEIAELPDAAESREDSMARVLDVQRSNALAPEASLQNVDSLLKDRELVQGAELSVQQIKKSKSAIQVYPNKEKGFYTILLNTKGTQDAVITIVNTQGEPINEFKIKTNVPKVFYFEGPPGNYLFTAETLHTSYKAIIIIAE